ncbi:LGFP repeat-containing protein [Corynebacterium marquesiae]|uniref:LGFP repeat-containing protein n=1 Tax=Corynebacterium marquesiae TaxID=2913503 RepID=UPI0038D0B07A
MQKMTRRIAGGFAAATLSVALVACSDAEDAANDAKDTAGSVAADATDAAGSAAAEATSKDDADDSEDAEASDSEDADDQDDAADKGGATKSIATANGDVDVPADFASAIEEKKTEWGDVKSIEQGDDDEFLANFDNGNLLTFDDDEGAQPIVGKIAETWKEQGGLDSEVGLPKAAEEKVAQGKGWTQQFDDGVISWIQDESGKFTSSVEK